jgi:hypothetical protein
MVPVLGGSAGPAVGPWLTGRRSGALGQRQLAKQGLAAAAAAGAGAGMRE